jgi:hypothetical protein
MRNRHILIIIATFLAVGAKSQESFLQFDTAQFGARMQLAGKLVDYEYYMQVSLNKMKLSQESSSLEWFGFSCNNKWHTVGGTFTDRNFNVIKHVTIDSVDNLINFTGNSDTANIAASGSAFSIANEYFQLIRDTTSIYFSSFLWKNPDSTISIWFLPAFQPSGQAIYGCEWEYVFDKSGLNLHTVHSYTGNTAGVWIGQPRELWLNYRNTVTPTVGSIYFALSFCDYFTRLRIDTRSSTSTLAKDSKGKYSWSHRMKPTTH